MARIFIRQSNNFLDCNDPDIDCEDDNSSFWWTRACQIWIRVVLKLMVGRQDKSFDGPFSSASSSSSLRT